MADNSGLVDLIKSRHSTYDSTYWEMLWAAYMGGKLFCNPLYVDQHKTEDHDLYVGRLNRLFYPNYLKSLNSLAVDYVFRGDDITRTNSNDPFLNDVDRCGCGIDTFMSRAAKKAIVTGLCYIIVDSPYISYNPPRNLQEEKERKIGPYWTIRDRKDILNWELDEFGEPYWVLVKEARQGIADWHKATKSGQAKKEYFKLWTRTDWMLIESDIYQYGANILIGPNAHNFNTVPIVPLYGEYIDNWQGASWNEDAVYLAKALLNVCSLRMDYNYQSALEQIVFPGDAETVNDIVKGNSWILAVPPEAVKDGFAPYSLSCTGSAAEILRNQINDLRDEIHRLLKQRILNTSAASDGASGVSKQEDFKSTQTSLASLAASCERTENRLHELTQMVGGQENSATYPNQFDVETVEQAIDQLVRLESTDTVDELLSWMQQRVAKLLVGPHGNQQELNEIVKAIKDKYISEAENVYENTDQELYEYHIKYGAVTINEIRNKLGLPPIEGGDKFVVDQSVMGNNQQNNENVNGNGNGNGNNKQFATQTAGVNAGNL